MSFEAPAGTDRRLVTHAIRRRWVTIVVAVVIGALVGAAVGAARPQIYKSSMSIIITPLEGNPYSPESLGQRTDANTDVQTDARLAATPVVAGLVEHALRLVPGSLGWRSRLSVTVVPNSQVITVAYRSANAAKAKQVSEAFGESYLSYRAQRSQESVSSQLAALDERGRQVQKSLTAAGHNLDTSSKPSDRAYLNQQVATYTEQLAAIADESARLSSASRDPGQVLTPAGDAVVSGLTPSTYGALGAIAGLLVGLAIAIARQLGDRRLHEPAAVEEAGVPVLAELGPSGRRRGSGGRGVAPGGTAEQYRVLRTAVVARARAPHVIVVSGLAGAPQTAELAMQLGEALSRTGHDATVVLTTSNPQLDGESGDESLPGLSDVLLGGSDPLDVRASIAPGLYLVRAGRHIDAAADRFVTEDMRAALRTLASTGDYVVVAAPGAATSDALALAAAGDSTVLVCRLGTSTRDELVGAVRELQRVGAPLMGAVVVARSRGRFGPAPARRAGDSAVPAAQAPAAAPEGATSDEAPRGWGNVRPAASGQARRGEEPGQADDAGAAAAARWRRLLTADDTAGTGGDEPATERPG